jgi:hypothetical protein
MEDSHSRAYGLAHQEVLVELLKTLMHTDALSLADARALLTVAGQRLLSKQTDVAVAASEQVKMIGEAIGID